MSLEIRPEEWDRVEREIEVRAVAGLNATLYYALDRATRHAPVRSIFRRTRRGPDIRIGPGQHGIQTQSAMDAFKRGREHSSSVLARGHRTLGHANSFRPVMRVANGDRMTGDLRRIDNKTHGLATVPVDYQQGRRASLNGTSFLSSRGRYEVAHAFSERTRLNPTTGKREITRLGAAFGGRVGGRLRGEIFVQNPAREGSEIWGYVVSPTPYAAAQEFGTRHNRSHPFLRPALYESRAVFRQQLRGVATSGGRMLIHGSLAGRSER